MLTSQVGECLYYQWQYTVAQTFSRNIHVYVTDIDFKKVL